MIKICHVLSGDLWAGAEVMLYTLLKGLQIRQKFTLAVIVFNDGRLAKELRNIGIDVYVVDESENGYLAIISAVRGVIVEIGPDIIHSHGFKEGGIAFVASQGGSKKQKLIATQHSIPLEHTARVSFKSKVKTWGTFCIQSLFFSKIIAVSEDIKDKLLATYHFPVEKVETIHNGIEICDQPTVNVRRCFTIGAAARFYPVKDFPLLMEVARECRDRNMDFKFLIAGDGPGKLEVKRRIAEYGLEKVCILLGHIDDMQKFYCDIDVFINTSLHEGMPISILEAMSYGKPVVAPNVGGIGEIFTDNSAGSLVDGRLAREFADKCIELAADKKLYDRMSQSAKLSAESRFSMESMAEAYAAQYRTLFHPA